MFKPFATMKNIELGQDHVEDKDTQRKRIQEVNQQRLDQGTALSPNCSRSRDESNEELLQSFLCLKWGKGLHFTFRDVQLQMPFTGTSENIVNVVSCFMRSKPTHDKTRSTLSHLTYNLRMEDVH